MLFAGAVLAGTLMTSGCGEDPGGAGPEPSPTLDPAGLGGPVDNPYLPLTPGTRYRYVSRTADGVEVIRVEVTGRTRRVLDVPAVVVRDTVSLDGEVVEDTYDWFAQDRQGNVWYLGEDTKEYEEGRVTSTEGSWEAGVDGARPGIVMPAKPVPGPPYRQEHYPGHAEDMGQVVGFTSHVDTEYGGFDRVLVTREWNPLEPGVVERKYYARGVGLILEEQVKGGSERAELTHLSPAGEGGG
jgi:hypothetical protein